MGVVMVMRMVMRVAVLIDRHHLRHFIAEHLNEFGVAGDAVRRAGAANMMIEAYHLAR